MQPEEVISFSLCKHTLYSLLYSHTQTYSVKYSVFCQKRFNLTEIKENYIGKQTMKWEQRSYCWLHQSFVQLLGILQMNWNCLQHLTELLQLEQSSLFYVLD